jgi:hypothetical protein
MLSRTPRLQKSKLSLGETDIESRCLWSFPYERELIQRRWLSKDVSGKFGLCSIGVSSSVGGESSEVCL